jgi:hypothetical protein
LRFDNVWQYNAATTATPYLDYTNNSYTNTDFNFLSSSANYYYFGLSSRFTGMFVDLTTAGSYSGLSYQYYDGDVWQPLALIDSYAWDSSKYVRWVLPKSNWVKYNFNQDSVQPSGYPDTTERYWVRLSASGVVTTAVINKIRAIPYVFYSTPTKVSQLLSLKKDFDYSTTPSDLSVEDMIKRAEDRIDYRTRKSWKFNAITEDTSPTLVDYNRYGFFLRHRNFRKVYSVSLWNGGSWAQLTEGRNNDYFINYDLGMVYLTRLFLLPAAYGMTGRYFHWGFGEYKNSIKVDYVYGRDPEVYTEFYIVEDIATKMAACDVLRHHDYSGLIVSGTDKVPLESKIRLMEEQIEGMIDTLTGVAIY